MLVSEGYTNPINATKAVRLQRIQFFLGTELLCQLRPAPLKKENSPTVSTPIIKNIGYTYKSTNLNLLFQYLKYSMH